MELGLEHVFLTTLQSSKQKISEQTGAICILMDLRTKRLPFAVYSGEKSFSLIKAFTSTLGTLHLLFHSIFVTVL